jgi:hypothetical protein
MTLSDVGQLLEMLADEENIPYELDDLLPFIVKQAQDMNLLSRDVSTNYVDIMRKAIPTRYDLRPRTSAAGKKTSKKEKERKIADPDAPSTSQVPDSPPLKRRKGSSDNIQLAILDCLHSVEEKLDTTNTLLGQLINNFQSWRQLDLPRSQSAVSMAPPSLPSVQTSAVSAGQESLSLLTPMILD